MPDERFLALREPEPVGILFEVFAPIMFETSNAVERR